MVRLLLDTGGFCTSLAVAAIVFSGASVGLNLLVSRLGPHLAAVVPNAAESLMAAATLLNYSYAAILALLAYSRAVAYFAHRRKLP